MSHVVRRMQRADLGRVEAIFRQHAPGVPMSDWLPVAEHAIDEPTPAPLALVAEAPGGRVIGYIVGAVRCWEFGSPPAGWIIGIGVDVEHKKSGAGADLLGQLVRSFDQRQVHAVRTMVRRDEVSVLRFFRSAGFSTGPYVELEVELPR